MGEAAGCGANACPLGTRGGPQQAGRHDHLRQPKPTGAGPHGEQQVRRPTTTPHGSTRRDSPSYSMRRPISRGAPVTRSRPARCRRYPRALRSSSPGTKKISANGAEGKEGNGFHERTGDHTHGPEGGRQHTRKRPRVKTRGTTRSPHMVNMHPGTPPSKRLQSVDLDDHAGMLALPARHCPGAGDEGRGQHGKGDRRNGSPLAASPWGFGGLVVSTGDAQSSAQEQCRLAAERGFMAVDECGQFPVAERCGR